MTDLVSRLLEAIGETERLASFREELPGIDFGITDSKSWHTRGCGYRQSEWMEACDCDVPSSVLRRCAADRRVLERHSPTLDHLGRPSCSFCSDAGHMEWPCEDFEDLADRYGLSDHQEGEE